MTDFLDLLDLVLHHLEPATLVANDRKVSRIGLHIRIGHGLAQILQQQVQRLQKLLTLDAQQLQNGRSLYQHFVLGEYEDYLPWIAQMMMQLRFQSGCNALVNRLQHLFKVLQSLVPFGLARRRSVEYIEI